MENQKTVKEILKASEDYLAGKQIESPGLVAELLLSRLLACKRLELCLRFETVLADKLMEAMRRGIKRVAAGEPVQYVLGQTEFMGHVIKCDKRALIPRPETEVLVETVLKCDRLWQAEQPALVDIGTGTGCIAISLALARPAAKYLALDISEEAISLAKENATVHGVQEKIIFATAELADLVEPGMLDAIVSNPPYITTAECGQLPVQIRAHEPRTALDGGEDGLQVIDAIVQDAGMALKPGGQLFLEIGDTQAEAVRAMLAGAGFGNVTVTRDLAGKDRIISGEIS